MKYALVNGIRQEPAPKSKGTCCHCGGVVQAKCGRVKVWHWAHVNLQSCDLWWENETEWHRLWKSYFPAENQEVIHFDGATGEKHIADIKTNNKMVIEIQNSPIDELELLSRENFYGNMFWIVNGENFIDNFTILGKLPKPNSDIAQELIFIQPEPEHWYVKERFRANNYKNDLKELIPIWVEFYIRVKNPDCERALELEPNVPLALIERPSPEEYRDKFKRIEVNYIGHHTFIWKKPRSVWFNAKKPVFIDFGGNNLWLLKNNDFPGLKAVRKISKSDLVKKNGGFYKIG